LQYAPSVLPSLPHAAAIEIAIKQTRYLIEHLALDGGMASMRT
jgi:hypothetical protein